MAVEKGELGVGGAEKVGAGVGEAVTEEAGDEERSPRGSSARRSRRVGEGESESEGGGGGVGKTEEAG